MIKMSTLRAYIIYYHGNDKLPRGDTCGQIFLHMYYILIYNIDK